MKCEVDQDVAIIQLIFLKLEINYCFINFQLIGKALNNKKSLKSFQLNRNVKFKYSIAVIDDHAYFREVSTNQSSASTVVSGGSSASQHQIMPATSPLSQFATNGEVQKLRTTTPPHNLSNPQTQQRG